MFDYIKRNLYIRRTRLLFKKGIYEQKIVPFNGEFYNKLNHVYVSGLPVSIRIKYLKPTVPPGKCFDRSLYMFFCFDDAILVRGNNKDLELRYGIDNAEHGWIEIGNFVYDPSLLMRFDKDLYYEIYKPTNIYKCTKEEYCSDEVCNELYNSVRNTTIDSFKPYGNKRLDLSMTIPLITGIAQGSGNQEFINELNDYIKQVQYDEEEIYNELNEEMVRILS